MPGDLLTLDYQMQLDSWLGGTGQEWDNILPGWSDPTGAPTVGDVAQLGFSSGGAAGYDRGAPIVFTASMSTAEANIDEATAWDAIVDLRDAWAPTGNTDKELWLQMPGLGVVYLVGRPRAPEVNIELIRSGVAIAMVTFIGLTGVLHYEGS